jgi:rRNA maturation protein Rpf1
MPYLRRQKKKEIKTKEFKKRLENVKPETVKLLRLLQEKNLLHESIKCFMTLI